MDTSPQIPSDALSDLEKERIIAEERFRRQIRDELDPPKPPRSRLGQMLNAPLGLLLVSSVLISGVGALLGKYNADNQAAAQQRQELSKHLVEHNYRLVRAAYMARFVGTTESGQSTCVNLYQLLDGIPTYQPTMPEFQGQKWLGVVWRIGWLSGANRATTSAANDALVELDGFVRRDCREGAERAQALLTPLRPFAEAAARSLD